MASKRRTINHSWRTDTDASFRAWGKHISDSLVAVGLVRENAVDWNTVTRPAAYASGHTPTSVANPTERFRLGGPLQAGYPVSFTLYYSWRSDNGTLGHLGLRVDTGLARLDPDWLTSTVNGPNQADGTSHFASDGENWLTFMLGQEIYAQGQGTLAIERYRDENGGYVDGAYVVQGGIFHRVVPVAGQTGVLTPNRTVPVLLTSTTGGSSVLRGRVAMVPHAIPNPGQAPQVIYGCWSGDFAKHERFTLPDGRSYIAQDTNAMPQAICSSSTTTPVSTNQSWGRMLVRTDGASV